MSEALDDIVAAKRRRADEMAKTLGDQHSYVEAARWDADRIEAAVKLEREKAVAQNATVSGNVAALREALAEARKVIKAQGGYWAETTLPIIDAALAVPPRNCDRFATEEEAWLAFERERPNWCDEHSSKDLGCLDCEMADCGRCMAEWLFEKEGCAE